MCLALFNSHGFPFSQPCPSTKSRHTVRPGGTPSWMDGLLGKSLKRNGWWNGGALFWEQDGYKPWGEWMKIGRCTMKSWVGIWTGNDARDIIVLKQTWKSMKKRGLAGIPIFKRRQEPMDPAGFFLRYEGYNLLGKGIGHISYLIYHSLGIILGVLRVWFTGLLKKSPKLGYKARWADWLQHVVTFMGEIYMTPESCSQRPPNHSVLETQNISSQAEKITSLNNKRHRGFNTFQDHYEQKHTPSQTSIQAIVRTCRFPTIGLPHTNIHFHGILQYIKHPAIWGTPMTSQTLVTNG